MSNQSNETWLPQVYNNNTVPPASTERTFIVVLEASLYGVIAIISIIGNSFLILAYRRNITGQMRSVYNLLVASIGAGDLLLAVWSIPERMTRVLMNDAWIVEGMAGMLLIIGWAVVMRAVNSSNDITIIWRWRW